MKRILRSLWSLTLLLSGLATPALADFETAETAYRAKDFETARREYTRAAEAGDVRALRALGILAARGEGVEKDLSAAAVWFRKAADAGHAPAMHDLARLLYTGAGVSQDVPAAVALFEESGGARSLSGIERPGYPVQHRSRRRYRLREGAETCPAMAPKAASPRRSICWGCSTTRARASRRTSPRPISGSIWQPPSATRGPFKAPRNCVREVPADDPCRRRPPGPGLANRAAASPKRNNDRSSDRLSSTRRPQSSALKKGVGGIYLLKIVLFNIFIYFRYIIPSDPFFRPLYSVGLFRDCVSAAWSSVA